MSIQSVNKSTGDTSRIAGGTLWADSPIGTILAYGGATAPAGWFLCQGQAISRTTYSELFAVIGTSFGSGDGSTTFNLPDLREATTKGVGLNGKSNNHYDSDGVALGEFVEDRIQTHNHALGLSTTTGSNNNTLPNMTIASGGNTIGAVSTYLNSYSPGRYGDTTEVKAVGVNYIIKAKMVAMPSDFMSKVDEAVEEVLTPEDISNTVTVNDTYADNVNVIKSGKVIDVYLTVKSGSTVNPICISGLPIPVRTNAYGSLTYSNGNVGYVRVDIANDTSLKGVVVAQQNSALSGTAHITYISA